MMVLKRSMPVQGTTIGDLEILRAPFCKTLEDQIREIPGVDVAHWKVKAETAIPAGTYELELVDSPAHGPDTMRLKDVPGFACIDIHSGVSKVSTEGCILVGDRVQMTEPPTISGGLNHRVLERLKSIVVPLLKQGETVKIEIRNPPAWPI